MSAEVSDPPARMAIGPAIKRVARFSVAGYRLAVDARLVEQVISEQLELTPLPLSPRHVPGAVRVRDTAVPLLDVAALFGSVGSGTRPPLTMIVSHPRGRFAIPVDALHGLFTARSEHFSEIDVQHPSADGVFTHLYTAPDGDGVDVLLDVDAVARVGELHSVLATHATKTHKRVDLGSTYFVVETGGRKLAFAAHRVRHVQSSAMVDRVGFTHRALLGFYQLGAERIAVVELAVVLGLGEKIEHGRTCALVVIGDERGAPVAFAVSRIVDMERMADDTIRSLADDDGGDHPLWHGTYQSSTQGAVLVADCSAVWSLGNMVDSRALFGDDVADVDQLCASQDAVAHMIYRVSDGLLASRVCDARAVVALPEGYVDLRGSGDSLVGLCTHKHRTVQVMDLASLMGRTPVQDPIGSPVIVINTDRGLLGLLVSDVVCMRPAIPSRIPGASRRPYGIIPAFTEMVQVNVDGADRGVTVLDLDALGDHGDLMQLMSRRSA